MAFIELIESAGDGAPVTNHARAFAHRPAVYAAWAELLGAIKSTMDERLYELVTLAAARELHSSYCALAHGRVLVDRFLPTEAVIALASDPRSAPATPVETAAMRLARKVVADATSVSAEDVDELRTLGLSDAEIFDIVAAAAVRCFFSKTLDALGVQPDAEYAELAPELRDALVTGRPIERPTGRGPA
jgi:uncharacterized peroxidase-related enzyme